MTRLLMSCKKRPEKGRFELPNLLAGFITLALLLAAVLLPCSEAYAGGGYGSVVASEVTSSSITVIWSNPGGKIRYVSTPSFRICYELKPFSLWGPCNASDGIVEYTTAQPYTVPDLAASTYYKIAVFALTEKKNIWGKWKNPKYRKVATKTVKTLDPSGNIVVTGATTTSLDVNVTWSNPSGYDLIRVGYKKTWGWLSLKAVCSDRDRPADDWTQSTPRRGWMEIEPAVSSVTFTLPNLRSDRQYKLVAYAFPQYSNTGVEIGVAKAHTMSKKKSARRISLLSLLAPVVIYDNEDIFGDYLLHLIPIYGENMLFDYFTSVWPELYQERDDLEADGDSLNNDYNVLQWIFHEHDTIFTDWQDNYVELQLTSFIMDNYPERYDSLLAEAYALTPVSPLPLIGIQKTHNTIQGQAQEVAVTTENVDYDMGGFDFMIAYDASALGLQSAIPGPAFYDPAPDGCGWEYFTYRHGPSGNCGDACPSGMVRVLALAETNNGPNHPSCFMPDSLPATLFTLDFLVTNDRTFECMYIPIKFYWTDCGDNSISSMDGEVLFVSDHIYEFEGTEITDSTFGFPTYFGVQPECLNPDPDKPSAIRALDYLNGGVDIVCADSIDDRGDINLNGVVNEVADAVLYSNYFVHGISVFNINIDGQIAASDVNADGITLSVADLVYMIRIITGDAPPYPKLTPVAANAELVNGVLSVDTDMGAAYVVVERSITPQLLAESMVMKYQYDADHDLTRILVYSMDKDQRFAGDFLGGIDGNVITLEMATYEGAPVTTKLVPDQFALYPSYPNPFNPVTTISFALASLVDYELVIYNSLGQTVKTFSGHSGPGLERVDWNASGFASGVYFYRLTAGDFTDTKKMVLLK